MQTNENIILIKMTSDDVISLLESSCKSRGVKICSSQDYSSFTGSFVVSRKRHERTVSDTYTNLLYLTQHVKVIERFGH